MALSPQTYTGHYVAVEFKDGRVLNAIMTQNPDEAKEKYQELDIARILHKPVRIHGREYPSSEIERVHQFSGTVNIDYA